MAKPKQDLDNITEGMTLSIRVSARTYNELCKQAKKQATKPGPLARFFIEEKLGLNK